MQHVHVRVFRAEIKDTRLLSLLRGPLEQVRVLAPGNRKFSAWVGGSRLTELPQFDDSLMWREDWEEFGLDALDDPDVDVDAL